MSKISKLVNTPSLFFKDMIKKPRVAVKAAPKDISYYRNQLLDFKNKYPVSYFKYQNIDLWPVLRFALWRGLRQSWQKNGAKSKIIPLKTTVSKEAYKVFRDNYEITELHKLEENIHEFLVFSNVRGVEQTIVQGKIYNKYTDPIYEELIKVGKTLKIEIIKGNSPIQIEAHCMPLRLLPSLTREVGYMIEAELPNNLVSILQNNFSSLNISQKDINDTIEWFMNDYNIYKQILIKLKPKAVFFMGFEFHLALSAAARDLGIRSVDVQHGLQTGWGPLYKWWEEIPPTGYNTLPTDFLVWGNRDKNHLEKEIALKNKANVYITGFPWIEKQFLYTEKLNSDITKKFDKYKAKILVSLQHQTEIPFKFIQLLNYSIDDIKKNLTNQINILKDEEANTNKIEKLKNKLSYFQGNIEESEILWIFRKHPKGKNIDLKGIEKRKNVLVSDTIDNVQIGELLKKVDIHITSSSTVVIEADYFGIHNFIADEDSTGIENYQDEIEKGLVSVLDNSKDFYKYIWNNDITLKESKIDAISQNNDLLKFIKMIDNE